MTSARDPAAAESGRTSRHGDRRTRARLIAAALLGALLTLFAVLNSQTVTVHWIVATTNMPMIVVIVISGLVGAGIAGLVRRRRRARAD